MEEIEVIEVDLEEVIENIALENLLRGPKGDPGEPRKARPSWGTR